MPTDYDKQEGAIDATRTQQDNDDDDDETMQEQQEQPQEEQQDMNMNDVDSEMLLLQYLQQEEWGGVMNIDDDDDEEALVLLALQQEEWNGQEQGLMPTLLETSSSSLPKTPGNVDEILNNGDNGQEINNSDAPFDETMHDNKNALTLQDDEAHQQDDEAQESSSSSSSLIHHHNNNEFETEALLLQTPVGRALKLVERLVLLWHAHSQQWQQHILLLGHDDIVFMAEQLVQLQETFQQQRRPVTVDVGYHWTRPENIDQIRMDGLLTKRERDDLGIQSHYNGSSYGDGVYTADNPYNFYSTYGPVCLLLARLVGFKGKRSDGADVDTVVDNAHRMAVLKSSSQCFPIFSFPETLFDPNVQSDIDGKELIVQCHVQVQRILDEFLNDGFETPMPPSLHAPPTNSRFRALWHTSARPAIPPHQQLPVSRWQLPPPQPQRPILQTRRRAPSSRFASVGQAEWEISHIVPKVEKRTVHVYTAPDNFAAPDDSGKSPSARMAYFRDENLTCQGYSKGTIVITYSIHKQKQRPYHPNPNEFHDSLQRLAFLPDNTEGNALVKRLEEAFLAGWTFEVKTHKPFPNAPNSVDWMVPHKTLLATGFDGYAYTEAAGRAVCGFPDPKFFDFANKVLDGYLLKK